MEELLEDEWPQAEAAHDPQPGLVLTVRPGERVLIGEEGIVVTVARVRGEQVRIRFAAPPHVRVDREVVRRAKAAERGARD